MLLRLSGAMALAVWAFSLAMPAVEDDGGDTLGWQVFYFYPMFAMFGVKAHWSALLFLVAWGSNLLLIYACVRLVRADASSWWLVGSLWVAILYDLAFLRIWMRAAAPLREGGSFEPILLGPGYWLWIAALLIATIATSLACLEAHARGR